MANVSFIDSYGKAKSDKRADIILDYYQDFPSIIEGEQKLLVLKIKNAYEYVFGVNKGREVMFSSGTVKSDPTAQKAVRNVYIEELVWKGENISNLLHCLGSEEKLLFSRQHHILTKMQEEYVILQTQLLFLNNNEKKIFELYTESGHDYQKIADQEGIQQESARKRVWAIRKKIKNRVTSNMLEEI